MDITLHVDLKRIAYAGKLMALIATTLLSGKLAGQQIELFLVSESLITPPSTFEYAREEALVYLDPPNEQPLFLAPSEVIKKAEALMWEKRDFLLVDLTTMVLTHFEQGVARDQFPLAAQPRQGSFFDMPAGLYRIQRKTLSHASKIEALTMPFALHLFGNYVIHGTPNRLGKRAASTAGITLSPEHSRAIFAKTVERMPVLIVREEAPTQLSFRYFRKTNLPHKVPEVTAAGAIAADLETGAILFEKNKNDPYPTASVAKLMTAAVATETLASSTVLTITDEILSTYGNSAGLVKGEQFTVANLLYALILPSSNDAARAYELTRNTFLSDMNKAAQKLGMAHSRFADGSGLDQNTIASAHDLFKLLHHLFSNHPAILSLSRLPSFTARVHNKKTTHTWNNINWPRGDARFLGGKAGWTEDSLQTMAGVFGITPSEYGSRPIGIVVLGSRNRVGDVRAIIRYLEGEFIYGAVSADNRNDAHIIRTAAAVYEAVQ